MVALAAAKLSIAVSIRAPLRGAGRFSGGNFFTTHHWFQSAPRSEERGDRRKRLT